MAATWWGDGETDETAEAPPEPETTEKPGKKTFERPAFGLVPKMMAYLERTPRPAFRVAGIHPSEVYDLCPRRVMLSYWFPRKPDFWAGLRTPGQFPTQLPKGPAWEQHPVESQLIFDFGTAVHSWWQNRYLGPMGVLIGRWRCSRCLVVVKGRMPKGPCTVCHWPAPPASKGTCQESCVWPDGFAAAERHCGLCRRWGHWEHQETAIRDEELDIVGQIDGEVIYDAHGVIELFDLKTLRGDRLQSLRAPDPKHIWQVNTYMYYRKRQRGLIIYIPKITDPLTMRRTPPKEFVVYRRPAIIKEIKKRATLLMSAFKREMGVPSYRICSTQEEPRAVKCPYLKECFSAKTERRVQELRKSQKMEV